MKTTYHTANSRGITKYDWLESFHSFSFAEYYNPERIHFGTLRVINDDTIAPGMGFGTHPHDNMEIITIPLEGDLEHKDNMGNGTIIKHGEVQVMSAGTGITHSEFNPNKDSITKLLQIWVYPNKRNVTPRYGQMNWLDKSEPNKLTQIISPNESDEGLWIHQDAWFNIGTFSKGKEFSYSLKGKNNGLYIFVIKGKVFVEYFTLDKRDALGIWDIDLVTISCIEKSMVLLIEVPIV